MQFVQKKPTSNQRIQTSNNKYYVKTSQSKSYDNFKQSKWAWMPPCRNVTPAAKVRTYPVSRHVK